MNPQKIALCAVTAALLCAIAPIAIPFGAVPLSLATMILYVIASCVEPKTSVISTALYLLLGCAGLPVFSGFTGGFQRITGVTGGFLIGYIPCVIIIGLLVNKFESKKFIYPVSMAIGTAVCYICGTAWYIFQTNSPLSAALTVCVLPFMIGDAVKITLASIISITLRPTLKRIMKF